MSNKKSALGNIPSFNLGSSVANINGIPISNTEEPKQEEVKKVRKATAKKELAEKEPKQELKKELEKINTEEILKKIREEKEREIEEDIKETIKKLNLKEESTKIKKVDNRPSNKKHLKEGYTRQTFAVKDEHLELLRALAIFKGIEQKQLLEALLNKAFDSIDTKTKEEALNYYNNDKETEDLDLFI